MISLHVMPEAQEDMREIGHFIAQDNLDAANLFIGRLKQRFADLTLFPNVGRKGDGYRTVTEGDYVLFYRLHDKDTVVILRIVHGMRDLRNIIID